MSEQLSFGERLKEEGMGRVSENNQDWLLWARTMARWFAERNGTTSTNDIRNVAKEQNMWPNHP